MSLQKADIFKHLNKIIQMRNTVSFWVSTKNWEKRETQLMPYRMMKYGNPISQSSRFSILKYLPFCLRPRSGFRSGQRIALVYSWYQKNKSEAIHTIFRRHFLLLVNNAMAIDIWHRLVQKTFSGTRFESLSYRNSSENICPTPRFTLQFGY